MICSLRQHSGDGGHDEESGDENCQVGPQLIVVATSGHKIFPGEVVFSEKSTKFYVTRPKLAYGRQGLDWIVGQGYSFVVFSTNMGI